MFRIPAERRFRLTVISSKIVTVRARIRVLYDNGMEEDFRPPELTTSGTRINEISDSAEIMKRPGEVIACHVDFLGVGAKRGQVFAFVHSGGNVPEQMLARGYLFGNGSLILGQDEGMLSGKGHLFWDALADDIAPAAVVTKVLAATNARRLIWGFIWYYHSSGDVAGRGLRVLLKDIGLALPTGMTSGSMTTPRKWPTGANLDLTANQEGVIYASGKAQSPFSGIVDNAVISLEDASSTPLPFPLEVTEEDQATLLFVTTAGEAADRHSIYLLMEEWIEL